jgi:transposase
VYFFGQVCNKLRMAKPLVDDSLWAIIAPLLPKKTRRLKFPGRKGVSDRAALTGILFVLKSGMAWQDLPQELGCGSGVTCWRRLRDWQKAGVWDKLHRELLRRLQVADRLDWSRAVVDSSSVRAVFGGSRRGPTRLTAAKRAANIIFSPMPKAFRCASS